MTLTNHLNGSAQKQGLESIAESAQKQGELKYPVYLSRENKREHELLRREVSLLAIGTGYNFNEKYSRSLEDNRIKVEYEVIRRGLFWDKKVLGAYLFWHKKEGKEGQFFERIEVEFDNRVFAKADLENTLAGIFPDKVVELDDYQNDIRGYRRR